MSHNGDKVSNLYLPFSSKVLVLTIGYILYLLIGHISNNRYVRVVCMCKKDGYIAPQFNSRLLSLPCL